MCSEAACGITPRTTMTYTGEDLVGNVAVIAKTSTKAVPLLNLGRVVLEKHSIGMAMRCSDNVV